ncbi:MAG: hemopexin repeat-containing protein [Caldilineaceae bacterium]
MTTALNLPSFEELFGALDFKKGDDARSVYSPAAYLVDLLQLLDDKFSDEANGVFTDTLLRQRRADIKQILLNAENTFTEIPYLDIVNEVLAGQIDGDAFATLRTAPYPFNLPFDLHHARAQNHLGYLETAPAHLYKLFARQPLCDAVAQLFLGLSDEAYRQATIELTKDADIAARYDGKALAELTTVATFLKVTGLSGAHLRELLRQNLSPAEQAQGLAANFFINRGLGGYVMLSADEETLVWSADETPIPTAWFGRVNRFVRLAHWIGFSLTELDMVLRDCCGHQLDAAALRTVAVVKQLRDRYELPVDRVCSLLAAMSTEGMGPEKTPQDLFNRTFNDRWTTIEHTYIAPLVSTESAANGLPAFFDGCQRLTCTGDILTPNCKPYRLRVAKALGLSDGDLTLIVTRFRAKYGDAADYPLQPETDWALAELSLLHRLSTLAEVLDSSPNELLGLLDLLEYDPAIRQQNSFDLLIPAAANGAPPRDCHHILLHGETSDLLWLVQMLCALTAWMQANDLGADELKEITSGRFKDAAAQTESRTQKVAALANLYQQFKAVMLTADIFASERFDARAARVIHRRLVDGGVELVARADARLLRFAEAPAMAVAHQALPELRTIRAADFTGLGLEERLLNKLYDNLIMLGYLDGEGVLREELWPATAEAFVLANDFGAHRQAIFALVRNFLAPDEEAFDADDESADDEPADDEIVDHAAAIAESSAAGALAVDALAEAALFPTDLDELAGLTATARDELYDNLIFNGYIDEEGNVLTVAFFADPANMDDFQVNAALGDAAAQIYALIRAQLTRFAAQTLVLDASVFDELPLAPGEVDDLVENLRFNGYIDAQNRFVDKRALMAQNLAQFQLALNFYPHRRAILEALHGQIADFKAQFCTFQREAFAEIADGVAAQQTFRALAASYLSPDLTREEQKSFFGADDNRAQFALDLTLTDSEQTAIFQQIAQIFAAQQPYEFAMDLLAELDFDADETRELMETLQESGNLSDDLMLPADRVAYFLNVNNALSFRVEAFEDYNKDIFFALHAVAKEVDAAVAEIVEALQTQAASQESVLFEALQDAFGVDEALLRVICRHVLGSLDRVVETFMLPVLAAVDVNDVVAAEPADNRFNGLYRRIQQFAWLAAKLGLTATEAEIAFRDQDLAQKYPEKLTLPPELERFDALLEGTDGVLYLFKDDQYWTYAAATYSPLEQADHHIKALSERLAVLTKVDAAFVDATGTAHLIGRDANGLSHYFYKEKGRTRWVQKARVWGQVQSNFADPARIDAAFQDNDGKLYLFSGDQYVRYASADAEFVDEGYPLKIAGNWGREGLNAQLPRRFQQGIDAAFQGADGVSYLFKDGVYVAAGASAGAGAAAAANGLNTEMPINSKWGRVRNNFTQAARLDTAYVDGAQLYVFSGDQLALYDDAIENDGAVVRQGYPQRIEAEFAQLPAEFERNLEAAFRGVDGQLHFFKDGKTVALDASGAPGAVEATAARWGRVTNSIVTSGVVDAAFVGLDGYTYLFSGAQYVRYAGADYAQVDEGYPRLIAGDWGGLHSVNAAFVLDGKSYLFGRNQADAATYVCYSTRDYTTPDEGFPKEPKENWWNLPNALLTPAAGFQEVDAVFTGPDNLTYLFAGRRFVTFDNRHRWWSEPQDLAAHWDSIPFERVDAAFMGKDGKTYLFGRSVSDAGTVGQYVRYANANFSRVDDRYPKAINSFWGHVVNNIARSGRVDAALVLESREIVDEKEVTSIHTYLFSGNQYFRFVSAAPGDGYGAVENGYPKYIGSSLKKEPRFKNLAVNLESGIDAAFADDRTVYLCKDDLCHVVSEEIYKTYAEPGFAGPLCTLIEHGALFIEAAQGWRQYSAVEGSRVAGADIISRSATPALLRGAPPQFTEKLDAVLQGVDQHTYLFKGADCYDAQIGRTYPLAEEWGRPRHNIYDQKRVDAAFVGRDGKTYLFSGDQFVAYDDPAIVQSGYATAQIDGGPQPVSAHWGGLQNVALAYVQGEKTYLFEAPADDGAFRYVCYSSADYAQPDAGFPQTTNLDFWQIPADYIADGFDAIEAALVEGDNLFLLSGERYIQRPLVGGSWSYPRPLERIWRNFPLHKLTFPAVKSAFAGADGAIYFFAEENYVRYAAGQFTPPQPIRAHWGLMHNNFVRADGPKVDAAVLFQKRVTYLFAGDQYVRYSGSSYRHADDGYPKALVGNLRQEEAFRTLPDAFEEALIDRVEAQPATVIDGVVANARNVYLFMNGQCHVASQTLAKELGLNTIGRVRNNIVEQNRVDDGFVLGARDVMAGSDQRQTFLFAGDQYVRYSGGQYAFVDDGYPKTIASSFAGDVGLAALPEAFAYGIDAVVGRRSAGLSL